MISESELQRMRVSTYLLLVYTLELSNRLDERRKTSSKKNHGRIKRKTTRGCVVKKEKNVGYLKRNPKSHSPHRFRIGRNRIEGENGKKGSKNARRIAP